RRHTRFSRDWSSDVCSSDLHHRQLRRLALTDAPLVGAGMRSVGDAGGMERDGARADAPPRGEVAVAVEEELVAVDRGVRIGTGKIGRAACRERVWSARAAAA